MRPLRWLIIAGLATLVSAPAADVDSLARVLRDPDKTAEAKGDACLQLMDMGSAAAPAVPALVGLLNAQEEMLRDYAVTTLDRIGPAARNALPALRGTAAKDASPEIRELARSAIAKIRGSAPATARQEPAPAATEAPAPEQAAAPEPLVAKPVQTASRPAKVAARPTLEVHEGRFFRWAVPVGWVGSESANGVTLTAPDGLMQVSSALLLGSSGKTTPADFTTWMLGQIPENQSLQVIDKRDLPDQPSGLDTPWRMQELEMRYTVNRVPVRAIWTTGIVTMNGTYHAYLLGYQTVPAAFEHARLWLAAVGRSVSLASPVQGAGNERLLIPSNRPSDYPALFDVWREKGHAESRILKAQREGMMGYEQVKDPRTSRVFVMPMEAWDGAAGGYHNPLRPEEILQRAGADE
jgi:hypothetical protein